MLVLCIEEPASTHLSFTFNFKFTTGTTGEVPYFTIWLYVLLFETFFPAGTNEMFFLNHEAK